MKYYLIFALFLFGCETMPSKPTIVEVPVKDTCKITKPQKPDMPSDKLKKEDTLDDKVKAVLAEIERRKDYENQLETAIGECQ